MSSPRFPDPLRSREPLAPGATAPLGGLSLEQRIAALEQGAAAKERPILYYAKMYAANSGSPTYTGVGGAFQKVGSGGGTLTWTSEFDIRPSGVSAQVDTSTNKRLDVRKSGVYLVQATVCFASISSGKSYALNVRQNTTNYALYDERTSGATSTAYLHASELLTLANGDYLELWAATNDSSSEAYAPGTKLIYLSMMYVGPSA